MRRFLVCLILWLGGCHRSDNPLASPTPPESKPAPGLLWTMPKFLEGEFKNLDQDTAEASLDIDLIKDDGTRRVHINSGFQVTSCNVVEKNSAFVSRFVIDSRPDTYEFGSWVSETKDFKGRIILQKRYRSDGGTGIYRLDALVMNEKTSECVDWNFVFTPSSDTSVEFIEGSDVYLALVESLSATWAGLGADIEDL